MTFKLICFIILNSLFLRVSFAQCSYTWTTGTGIGSCYSQRVPESMVVKAASGAELPFSIRFADFDNKKATSSGSSCPSGISKSQAMSAAYSITFTISNSLYASFESSSSSISSKTVDSRVFVTNYKVCGATGTLFNSEPVLMYVKPGFNTVGQTFNVTVTVNDVTTLPPGDGGNLQDPPFSVSWTIDYDDALCPTSLSLTDPSLNSIWRGLYDPTAGTNGFVPYNYKCSPDLPSPNPDYAGKLISESFGAATADGFFTISDINTSALAPGITTADGVAAYYFGPYVGTPASFQVNNNDEFQDIHGGIGGTDQLFSLFGLNGFSNGKVGFSTNQSYKCNGTTISTPKLSKRFYPVGIEYDIQVRKIH